MEVRLSAPRAGRPGRFLVLISVRGWVDPRAIVRLEGLGQLKNPMTSSTNIVIILIFYISHKQYISQQEEHKKTMHTTHSQCMNTNQCGESSKKRNRWLWHPSLPENGPIRPNHVNKGNVWYICETNCVDDNHNKALTPSLFPRMLALNIVTLYALHL
jgi:hypothetical protein